MTHFNMLAGNNVIQQQTATFYRCWGVIYAACMGFLFGKTSLALVTAHSKLRKVLFLALCVIFCLFVFCL